MCLAGDGKGGFKARTPTESGVRIAGEQRGAAAADFDHDGRVDLAVGQNGGATRLFRNVAAKPGVRVGLRGAPGNPHGVGSVVRWKGGPAHSVHAGSGYWSSDAPVLTLARPDGTAELSVRWPGGRETVYAVAPDAREIICEMGGKIEIVR